jgi:hypothetical protein
MVWDLKESVEIYEELRRIAAKILAAIGCHTEPHKVNGKGKTRTCHWLKVNGKRRFRGVLYHYTGGVAEIGTIRWANHPGWGNTGSSWHVTILDRISDNIIGDLWIEEASDEIKKLFPVPLIIMADFRWGCWHGNWTNDTTLGVENRNGGYHGYSKAKNGLKGLGKEGAVINGRTWEPYTREQMVCNINFGRLANGLLEGELDPDWVLTHQCVWATKLDCGLAYPIHLVRNAIFGNQEIKKMAWLGAHPMAPDKVIEGDEAWKPFNEFRHEAEEDYVRWVGPTPEIIDQEKDQAWIAAQLMKIGFNTGPEVPDEETLRKQVRWFQRSTGAFRKKRPALVLKPDGISGPKTEKGLTQRLNTLNIV